MCVEDSEIGKSKLGDYYHDEGFIFTRDNGKPLHPDTLNGWLRKFSKRHDLPHIHPHAFRHTMASILTANTSNKISISNRMGHAEISTTEKIYCHDVDTSSDKMNADILRRILLDE